MLFQSFASIFGWHEVILLEEIVDSPQELSYFSNNFSRELLMMAEQIVSKRGDIYASTRSGRKIAEGETQNQAGYNGQRKYPDDVILAQCQRDTEKGIRDELRRLYPHKP